MFRSLGRNVKIWETAKLATPELISIGNNVIVDDFVLIIGDTEIGDYVHVSSFCSITGGGKCILEDFSGLSSGCRIVTGTEDFRGGCLTNPTVPAPYRKAERSFVHIKKHSIIGVGTIIMPGVTVGEGVAVGANSLVLKDCEPWTIYAGSPAKPVRSRPSEKILELEAELRAAEAEKNIE